MNLPLLPIIPHQCNAQSPIPVFLKGAQQAKGRFGERFLQSVSKMI